MMRKLFFIGTGLFWLALIALALVAWLTPPAPRQSMPEKPHGIALAEVARHASAEDCWMTIQGTVYDLSAYLPEHPTPPSIILPWCGKEATEAYQTKAKGRAHSPRADQALANYAIGVLESGGPVAAVSRPAE